MSSAIPETNLCSTCGGTLTHSGRAGGHCARCLFATSFNPPEMDLPDETTAPWTELSGLDLYEEIGRGGMGVVYRARQKALDRIVAVKVLLRARFAGPAERGRFHREAQAAARLTHPGIVGIHDVGEDEGVPWFSMEYIAGPNLERTVREHPMDARQAARCVQQVSGALQHAHEQGVLHRDLKPSNILLDEHGAPRITDFGIARIASGTGADPPHAGLTLTGQILGSPGYSAPEQALHGKAENRTDVYGLGALLYHLLTGRPPFQGPTTDAILVQLRESEPLSPRRLNPTVPRDLETICLKCLHKQADGRYQSARAVAEDLGRFLAGQSIVARPIRFSGNVLRWCRRRPALAAMVSTVLLLIAALVVGAVTFARRQQLQERRTALLAEARALRTEHVSGARTRALAALREAWKIQPSTELRSEAIAALSLPEITLERNLPASDPLTVPPSSSGSADGRFRLDFSEGSVVVIETSTGHEHARFSGYAAAPLAQLDDTGARLALVPPVAEKKPGEIRLHEIPSGKLLHMLPHPQPVTCLDWSGELLASGGTSDRLVYVWDTRTGERRHRFSGHDATLEAVRFRPDGQELVSIASDSFLGLWHAGRGVEVLRLEGKRQTHGPVWWSPDGHYLFCPRRENDTVDMFRFDWSKAVKVLSPGQDEPFSENLPNLHLNETGSLAAAVDETGCRLWSVPRGRPLAFQPKDPGEWMSAQVSDATGLWINSWNKPLRRIPIHHPESLWPQAGAVETTGREAGLLLVAKRADGQSFASTRNGPQPADDVVEVAWPLENRRVLLAQTDPYSAALSPDGTWCVTGSFTQDHAQLWSLPSGKLHQPLPHAGIVVGAAFVDGGRHLWLWGDRQIQCLDTATWNPLRQFSRQALMTFTISSDGVLAASTSRQEVILHRTTDLAELARLPVPSMAGGIGSASLAFSGNAQNLALHTATGAVIVWDLPALHRELREMDWAP